jgi:hypothetical protein
MPTLCQAFSTDDEARAAVDHLLASGLSGDDVRVLTGTVSADHRNAPVGSFAGAAAGSVGAFAGSEGSTADPMGAFAGDGDQRRGSFGDIDRELVTTYHAGVPQVRIASHRNLLKLLVDAGLDPAAASADVESLHEGRVLLLFRADNPDTAAATIDG